MFPLRAKWVLGIFLLLSGPGICRGLAYEPYEWDGETRPYSAPLPLRNDHPLYITLFATAFPDRARVLPAGRWQWNLQYLGSNSIAEQHNVLETDRIVVDAEVQRFELNARYGFDDQWEFSLTIPYLVVGGGYLDDFIVSFEDTFGFVTPGSRSSRPDNEFQYLFRVNREALIDRVDQGVDGLPDIPFQVKYRLRDEIEGWLPQMSLRAVVKFPTATNRILGSDRFDAGIGWLAEQPIGGRLLVTTNLDVTSAHLPEALETLDLDPVMVLGTVGVELFLTDRASVQAQTTLSTNPYPKFHDDMTALNRTPMGVGLGVAYRFSRRVKARLTVVENAYSAWSDFSWGAGLHAEF